MTIYHGEPFKPNTMKNDEEYPCLPSEVAVFRTDISDQETAQMVCAILSHCFPDYQINFDLEDCDRILRVASLHEPVQTNAILAKVAGTGNEIDLL